MTLATVANFRVDTSWKAGAMFATVLLHGALVFALTTSYVAPQPIDVGMIQFEMVDILNDIEVAETTEPLAEPVPPVERVVESEPAPPPPIEKVIAKVIPEPQPEPISEPVSEPEPVLEPVPEPVVEVAPKPEVRMFAPPRRKPVPPPLKVEKPKPAPRLTPSRREIAEIEPVAKPVVQSSRPVAVAKFVRPSKSKEVAFVPPGAKSAKFSNPKPRCPAVARRRGMEGRVMLLVEVNSNGRVLKVTVKKSSGHKILDKAALKAVNNWRFLPATRNGKTVIARLEVPIRFSLKDL